MKNILIIANGETANRFLQRLISSDATKNRYFIVYYDDKTIVDISSEKFSYHKFDPTSFSKLSTLLSSDDFYQCMVITDKEVDLQESYNNIRRVDENIQIVLVDSWNLEFNDKNITIIDAHDTLSNIFSNYLPDLPLYAQNLGLGTGEIMEFKVPFGSPYLYRHIRNIDQKRWKIAAIFREHKLILPSPSMMIVPNDAILAVGNPNVLKGVYKSVKREFGQFPIPFGANIYCYIDMKTTSDDDIKLLINDAMLLHSKLNNNILIFKVVNLRFSKTIDRLKSFANSKLVVEFQYHDEEFEDIYRNDITNYFIGLIVTNGKFLYDNLNFLYRLKLPIFKVSNDGFFSIKESIFLNSNSKTAEKVSSLIFDISKQMGTKISLFDVHLENNEEQEKIISHFQNLAKLFDEKINIIKTDKNPIIALSERSDFIQFVIFDESLVSSKLGSFLSTDFQRHFFRFKNNYQIFLPSD